MATGLRTCSSVPAVLPDAMAEMDNVGITRVVTHGETAAGYMDNGYARASGRPGCVSCPGRRDSANLAAGVRDAYLASSPVIAISGGPHPDSRYRYLYQVVEDFPMFQPVTKLNIRVDSPSRLPDLLRQAFRVATSGTPGPVHIENARSPRRGCRPRRRSRLTSSSSRSSASSPPTGPKPRGEPDLKERQGSGLGARRPVIVAGGGVAASQAWAEVVELAEKALRTRSHIPRRQRDHPYNHPLSVGVIGTYSRWCANRAVAEADLVFFIGSRAGGHTTANWRIPRPGTTAVQLDIDPAEIGRNTGVGGALRGRQGYPSLADRGCRGQRRVRKAGCCISGSWSVSGAPKRNPVLNLDATPIRPERLCKEIGEILPPVGAVVSDTGHAAIWSSTMIDFNAPGQRYLRCAGTLGWGLPASIGAKCALPDKPVLCFTGDGGFYYYISELETAARMGINVVVVVNNNHSLQQVKNTVDISYGGNPVARGRGLWVFKETNFAKIAEDMGCLGLRVERPAISGMPWSRP